MFNQLLAALLAGSYLSCYKRLFQIDSDNFSGLSLFFFPFLIESYRKVRNVTTKPRTSNVSMRELTNTTFQVSAMFCIFLPKVIISPVLL